MDLIFHERVGLDGRRISPFSWRIRYAFAHKGLTPLIIETKFADAERIIAISGQTFTPIIQDGPVVVHDTWRIACHLEDQYPDTPSLFGGSAGRAMARFISEWADTVLSPALRMQIFADFLGVLAPEDRPYYRQSREAMIGTTLEAAMAARDDALPALTQLCLPLQRTLADQPFLAGSTPAYADYATFSVFQYARIGSPRDVLALMPELPAVLDWRRRMIGLFNGLGDKFPGYPAHI